MKRTHMKWLPVTSVFATRTLVTTIRYRPEEDGAERVEDGALGVQPLGQVGRRAEVLEGELLHGAANVVGRRVEDCKRNRVGNTDYVFLIRLHQC